MDVREGGVGISVPAQSEGEGTEVFFNPEQELNRDLTIAVLRAFERREPRAETYLDAMTATGIRGIRAASDGWEVSCCDLDQGAVERCRANLARNELEATVHHRDVNALLHETYFDVVDIDPFGSPVPFLDAAFRGTRNLLCVTATDTAPLCGAHFESGVRRYSAVPRNTEYHPEMGVRILLSAIARTGARYDIAVEPLLTHATKHYVRTYLELSRGATEADSAVEQLGHLYHCQHCLWRNDDTGLLADPPGACPVCDRHVQTAGPVWLGPIRNRSFLEEVRAGVDEKMGTTSSIETLLERLDQELDTPTHYDQHRLCKRWGWPAPSMDEFLADIEAAGFSASRTHYSGTSFKTRATVTDIKEATDDDTA